MARKNKAESIEKDLENLQIDGEDNAATQLNDTELVKDYSRQDDSFNPTEYTRPDESDALREVENNELHDPEDPYRANLESQEVLVTKKVKKTLKYKHSKLYFGIFLVLALIAGVIFWFWRDLVLNLADTTSAPISKPVIEEIVAKEQISPEMERFMNPATGESWLKSPKQMVAQGWLKAELRETIMSGMTYDGVTEAQIEEAIKNSAPNYFEVGSRAGNQIIRVTDSYNGMAPNYLWFEQSPEGTVSLVAQPQSTAKYQEDLVTWMRDILTDKVSTVDTTIHYDSLSVPPEIPLKNGEVLRNPEYSSLDIQTPSVIEGQIKTLVSQIGQSKLYRVEKPYVDTKLTNISYEIEMPAEIVAYLRYEPNQESLEGYVFDNERVATYYNSYLGKTEYDKLHAIARGCGGSGANVTRTDKLKLSDIVQVGKTPGGRVVYQPKDKSSDLVQKSYDEYKTWVTDAKSLDEFIAEHGLLLIEDNDHNLLVYVRDQMGPAGGCAKPVVYLYPTENTIVSVRVGADVTVSEPKYEANGWQGVTATPSGQLTYNGTQYSSLFWEGYGVGDYPGIISGTVIKRNQAASTMRLQLRQQGLNSKEIADFMDFWQPRIPEKPYVRLTWFNTRQMETLAPLYISPKPDTVLRVFLDMDGFDKPIKLPSQKLTAQERRGFTVVEWGGLTLQGLR
ncbi:hypothetical protein EOL73_01705 [Candidatus Saccharibacteria bacterium]|nr:hypothetical protein [Candidatus Saccharibacteria bacterium]